MKLLLTKIAQGVIDTDRERRRIEKAFKKDPETRKRLNLLMDAIEAGHWKKADKMLSSRWWQGRDSKMECPRLEFVGMLDLQNPEMLGHPADGFNCWASYRDLVWQMTGKSEPGAAKCVVS